MLCPNTHVHLCGSLTSSNRFQNIHEFAKVSEHFSITFPSLKVQTDTQPTRNEWIVEPCPFCPAVKVGSQSIKTTRDGSEHRPPLLSTRLGAILGLSFYVAHDDYHVRTSGERVDHWIYYISF
jgi:hypothetical protein